MLQVAVSRSNISTVATDAPDSSKPPTTTMPSPSDAAATSERGVGSGAWASQRSPGAVGVGASASPSTRPVQAASSGAAEGPRARSARREASPSDRTVPPNGMSTGLTKFGGLAAFGAPRHTCHASGSTAWNSCSR